MENLTKPIRNNRGQYVIEAVLLSIVLVSMFSFVTTELRNRGYVRNLLQQPILVLGGMVESGVWTDASTARGYHPNHGYRHLSQETTK
jgi:hypothetical protein